MEYLPNGHAILGTETVHHTDLEPGDYCRPTGSTRWHHHTTDTPWTGGGDVERATIVDPDYAAVVLRRWREESGTATLAAEWARFQARHAHEVAAAAAAAAAGTGTPSHELIALERDAATAVRIVGAYCRSANTLAATSPGAAREALRRARDVAFDSRATVEAALT